MQTIGLGMGIKWINWFDNFFFITEIMNEPKLNLYEIGMPTLNPKYNLPKVNFGWLHHVEL